MDCFFLTKQNISSTTIVFNQWFVRRRSHLFATLNHTRASPDSLLHPEFDNHFLDELARVRAQLTSFMLLNSSLSHACRNWPLPSLAHTLATRIMHSHTIDDQDRGEQVSHIDLIRFLHSLFIMSGNGNVLNAVCAASQRQSTDGTGTIFMSVRRDTDAAANADNNSLVVDNESHSNCLLCGFRVQIRHCVTRLLANDRDLIDDPRPHVAHKRTQLAHALTTHFAWLPDALANLASHARHCKPMWRHTLATYDYADQLLIEYLHWDYNALYHYRTANVAAAIVLKKLNTATVGVYADKIADITKLHNEIASHQSMRNGLAITDAEWTAALCSSTACSHALAMRLFGGTVDHFAIYLQYCLDDITVRLERGGGPHVSTQGIRTLRARLQHFEPDKSRRGRREKRADMWKKRRNAFEQSLSVEAKAEWEAERLDASIDLLFEHARALPEACRDDVLQAYGTAVAELATGDAPVFLLSWRALLDRVPARELEQRGVLPPSKYEQGLRAVALALQFANATMASERASGAVEFVTQAAFRDALLAHLRREQIDVDQITDPIHSITLRHYGVDRTTIFNWLRLKPKGDENASDAATTRRTNVANALLEAQSETQRQRQQLDEQQIARKQRGKVRDGEQLREHAAPPIKRARKQSTTASTTIKTTNKMPGWSTEENARLYEAVRQHGRFGMSACEAIAAQLTTPERPLTAKSIKSRLHKWTDAALENEWLRVDAQKADGLEVKTVN